MCVSLTCVLCTTARVQSVETIFLNLGTIKNESESESGASLLLSTSVLQREREFGRYGDSSGGHDLTASTEFVQTVTPGVCGGQLPCVLQH